MELGATPLFERLGRARSVLIAGAGGGFDVYSGLPLYFWLKARGISAHLANLSFTRLAEVQGARPCPALVEVTAETSGPRGYFPEGVLARWLSRIGEPATVYCFDKVGARPLAEAYRHLQAALGFDCLVLVDGGTDILMRGDEAGLGTPQEDITSLTAASTLALRDSLIVCLGFGVDRFHGVCHAHFLEGVAALSREGAFLGVSSLLPEMPEVARFKEAVDFAAAETPGRPSIVSLSVASAIDGQYGDVHRTSRTEGSRLWINPLMSMYWGFDLQAVARRCLYLDLLRDTDTAFEAALRIEAFREARPCKPWEDIPV